ncbi:MAG: hypothetical protein CL878_15905 [Dehalococcoidia bacterium]|nr:hypothetical protein [Dehalococcoidia bacterium]
MTTATTDPCAADELQRYDVVPRKVHQYAMLTLLAAGYVVGATAGAWLLFVAAVFMVLGRFWRPFDIFRMFTVAIAQPAGLLPRRMIHEDHETRRIARVLGGIVFALTGGLLLLVPGLGWLAWALTGLVGVMILLDAVFDFCALCFVVHHFERLTSNTRVPASTA